MGMEGRGRDVAEIDPAECRDLLDTDLVGRIAFVTPAGPRIVPVNFAVVEESIEVRTCSDTELAIYAPGHDVAFEVDHLDAERRRGWSVVVHGRCEVVAEPAHPLVPGPRPWADGDRRVLLRVSMGELTGRRVGGVHWPHPVVSGRLRRY